MAIQGPDLKLEMKTCKFIFSYIKTHIFFKGRIPMSYLVSSFFVIFYIEESKNLDSQIIVFTFQRFKKMKNVVILWGLGGSSM